MAKHTIAVMDLILPNGDRHELRYDFGEGYSEKSARFMFFDGNYYCDCNRSYFLIAQGVDIKEFECGDTIQCENFHIEYEEK